MRWYYRSTAWFLVAAGIICSATAQEPRSDFRVEEVAAVRQAAQNYASALRRNDVDQLIALWTPDGDLVDRAGHSVRGRDLVEQLRSQAHAGDGQANRPFQPGTIRLVTATVAIEDGGIDSPMQADGPASHHYTALWVKQDGKWLLAAVREFAEEAISHHEHLQPLGWLVGNWEEQDGGDVVHQCRWSEDGNYLLREVKVRPAAAHALSVSQRIGWDASKQEIVSWTFDSDGGHATGRWSRHGNQWIARSTGQLPDGAPASSVAIYTPHSDDAFTWEITHRSNVDSPATARRIELVRRPSGGPAGERGRK